jgi:hypothetical protein
MALWPRAHGPLHQAGLNLVDGVDEADVRGDVDDLDLGRGQHHGHFLDTHEVREQLGVARVDVSSLVQRSLVQGGRADALDLAGHAQLAGDPDVVVGRVAGLGGLLAPRQVGRKQLRVDHVDPAGLEHGVAYRLHLDDVGFHAQRLGTELQPVDVADDHRAAVAVGILVEKGAHGHLGADAGSVAHGHGDEGAGCPVRLRSLQMSLELQVCGRGGKCWWKTGGL